MKTLQTPSWLPFFSGFYYTIHDEICDVREYDIDYYSEKYKKGITWDIISDFIDYEKARKEYTIQYTDSFFDFFANDFEKIGIQKIEHESLYSPKEYNFACDSINCIYTIKKEKFIKQVKKFLKEYKKEWSNNLKEKYTDRSGFWSMHDNFPESEEWQIENIIKSEHNLGSFLEFYLSIFSQYEPYELECNISEKIEFYIENYIDFYSFEKEHNLIFTY